jgi:hypothetical protein
MNTQSEGLKTCDMYEAEFGHLAAHRRILHNKATEVAQCVITSPCPICNKTVSDPEQRQGNRPHTILLKERVHATVPRMQLVMTSTSNKWSNEIVTSATDRWWNTTIYQDTWDST